MLTTQLAIWFPAIYGFRNLSLSIPQNATFFEKSDRIFKKLLANKRISRWNFVGEISIVSSQLALISRKRNINTLYYSLYKVVWWIPKLIIMASEKNVYYSKLILLQSFYCLEWNMGTSIQEWTKSYFQTLKKWEFKGLMTCDLVANLLINVIWLFV